MATGVLTSFWYYERFDFTRIPTAVPLVLDSGAFSAFTSGASVDLAAYAAWIAATHAVHPVAFAFNLDVLGDEAASLANWRRLAEAGALTVPVVHYGDDPAAVLPPYLRAGAPRLALGGLAVPGDGRQQRGWAATVLAWLREHAPATPVHGLGVHLTSPLAVLPWASTDSSGFTGAWRYARLRLWDPAKRRWPVVALDGRDAYRHGRLLREVYGTEPAEVASSTTATRAALVRLATRAEALAARDFDAARAATGTDRYLVTKPSVVTGVGLADVATEVDRFLVDGAHWHLTLAAQAAATAATDRYLTAARDPSGVVVAATALAQEHKERRLAP